MALKKHKFFDEEGEEVGNKDIQDFKAKVEAKWSKSNKRSYDEIKDDADVNTKRKFPSNKIELDARKQADWKNKAGTEKFPSKGTKRHSAEGGETFEKPDWAKIKQQKKELKIKRKTSSESKNETYDIGMQAKKIWEELRTGKCPVEKKKELCGALWRIIKGKTKSLIYAHDTVRVIETLLAACEEYRNKVFIELEGELLKLCRNKYSRFFVLKLLRYGTPEQKNAVISAMKGHVVSLMRHKIACDVVELAYSDCANAKQRSSMIQEFFGPRFKIFNEDASTLAEVIEKNPLLKDNILEEVHKAIEPILDKGIFTNVFVHTILKEYMYVCGETEKKQIIESLKEGLLPILHTRDGARVAMMCIWNGTPKDRKTILKSFKTYFVKIACEQYGHMVLFAAFDSIDDTVILNKVAIAELMDNVSELVKNDYGKKVLQYIVGPRSKLFFHPDILKVLQQGDDNQYSKKDRAVRYSEIQKFAAKPILTLIADNIKTWVKDSHWTLFIGAALQSLFDDSITRIFECIAETCAEPFIPGEMDHFLELSFLCKMISFLIQCDKQRFEESKPLFSSCLLDTVQEDEMRGWTLTNRGCFIFVKLLETEVPDIVSKVMELCKPLKSKISKMSYKGAEVLLKKLNA